MCEIIWCNETAEYLDDLDNELCENCMLQDVDENNKNYSDYEKI